MATRFTDISWEASEADVLASVRRLHQHPHSFIVHGQGPGHGPLTLPGPTITHIGREMNRYPEALRAALTALVLRGELLRVQRGSSRCYLLPPEAAHAQA